MSFKNVRSKCKLISCCLCTTLFARTIVYWVLSKQKLFTVRITSIRGILMKELLLLLLTDLMLINMISFSYGISQILKDLEKVKRERDELRIERDRGKNFIEHCRLACTQAIRDIVNCLSIKRSQESQPNRHTTSFERL